MTGMVGGETGGNKVLLKGRLFAGTCVGYKGFDGILLLLITLSI